MPGNESIERDQTVDFLRCTGILCVILAHTSPPDFVFQLRNFDVPLLVITSALTCLLFPMANTASPDFFIKRIARLVLPAWAFLTIYFAALFLASGAMHKDAPYSGDQILNAYLFDSTYVWILRIFLLIAVLTPFLLWLENKLVSHAAFFSSLLVTLLIYEGLYAVLAANLVQDQETLKSISKWLMATPYALLFLYGLRMTRLSDRALVMWMNACVLVFLLMGLYFCLTADNFVQTQEYKYPPRTYYLAYAIAIATGLYLLCRQQCFPKHKAIIWISQNSLWVFLWHILYVYIWDFLMADKNFTGIWLAKFFAVFAAACVTTYLQKLIVVRALRYCPPPAQKWGKIIFC